MIRAATRDRHCMPYIPANVQLGRYDKAPILQPRPDPAPIFPAGDWKPHPPPPKDGGNGKGAPGSTQSALKCRPMRRLNIGHMNARVSSGPLLLYSYTMTLPDDSAFTSCECGRASRTRSPRGIAKTNRPRGPFLCILTMNSFTNTMHTNVRTYMPS